MLTEGIIAEQDGIPCEVGKHAVRPVQHGGLDKDEFLGAE